MMQLSHAVWLLALVPACFHPSYEHPACGPNQECPDGLVCGPDNVCGAQGSGGPGGGDGGVVGSDAPGDPSDARQCFGTGLVQVCLTAPPAGDKTLATTSLDTSSATACTQIVSQAGGPDLCVIAARNLTVTGTVVATGTRALVLIAADTLVVQSGGTVDVSSKINGGARKGAAANTGTCSTLAHGGSDTGGGGGGAGGSLGTLGGKGGTGDTNNSAAPAGTAPGASAGTTQATPTILRGGCPGSAGGDDSINQNGSGVPGGDGGGAVYLIAGETITLLGDVFASGAGGGSNPNNNGAEQGGGGAGAGGMIGLDAPTIHAMGHVAANGGGGGGGGSLNLGGTAGGDGTTISWNTRASGGPGDQNPVSGNGGDGAKGTAIGGTTSLDGSDSTGGAGGGAGGLGLIWTYGALMGGTMISPAPIAH